MNKTKVIIDTTKDDKYYEVTLSQNTIKINKKNPLNEIIEYFEKNGNNVEVEVIQNEEKQE